MKSRSLVVLISIFLTIFSGMVNAREVTNPKAVNILNMVRENPEQKPIFRKIMLDSVQKELDQINANAPSTVDDVTTILATFIKDNNIIYIFSTDIGKAAKDNDADRELLVTAAMGDMIVNLLNKKTCADDVMYTVINELDVVVRYIYVDEYGNHINAVTVDRCP